MVREMNSVNANECVGLVTGIRVIRLSLDDSVCGSLGVEAVPRSKHYVVNITYV